MCSVIPLTLEIFLIKESMFKFFEATKKKQINKLIICLESSSSAPIRIQKQHFILYFSNNIISKKILIMLNRNHSHQKSFTNWIWPQLKRCVHAPAQANS